MGGSHKPNVWVPLHKDLRSQDFYCQIYVELQMNKWLFSLLQQQESFVMEASVRRAELRGQVVDWVQQSDGSVQQAWRWGEVSSGQAGVWGAAEGHMK